jgi:hypothetical protein
MDFMVTIDLGKLQSPINYRDRILLTGSCFTEHIGNALAEAKFSILQNPSGILFDPVSVSKSLLSYIDNRQYEKADLFQLNEIWHSWEHHSRFSGIDPETVIENINASQQRAHDFLKEANWIIITLGSSFSYRLSNAAPGKQSAGTAVANCHRAPAQWFNKHLLECRETISMLADCLHRLMQFNPALKVILTVSPVRHIRDGLVQNNRSKARLIEAVHDLEEKFENINYFPAYELVIDVLRDYRFYDVDLAHPNYMATQYVLEKFADSCIDETSRELMQEIRKIIIARKHKAFHPGTRAHRQFLENHLEKVRMLNEKYPFLDLHKELAYFSGT